MQFLSPLIVRNVVFGVEDSLVSTVGVLAGIASTLSDLRTIVLMGTVYIIVEAFSMGAGSFLSEESAQEYNLKKNVPILRSLIGALAMFVSSIVAGLLVLLPYLVFTQERAFGISIILALVLLGILGYVSARLSHLRILPRIVRMVVIGALAIVLGIVVGKIVGV